MRTNINHFESCDRSCLIYLYDNFELNQSCVGFRQNKLVLCSLQLAIENIIKQPHRHISIGGIVLHSFHKKKTIMKEVGTLFVPFLGTQHINEHLFLNKKHCNTMTTMVIEWRAPNVHSNQQTQYISAFVHHNACQWKMKNIRRWNDAFFPISFSFFQYYPRSLFRFFFSCCCFPFCTVNFQLVMCIMCVLDDRRWKILRKCIDSNHAYDFKKDFVLPH